MAEWDEEVDRIWSSLPSLPKYYDRAGKQIRPSEGMALASTDYNRVGEDYIGEIRVSTVWLGFNHRHWGDGPPLIFETAVFNAEGDVEVMDRYATEEEAEQGHAETVTLIRATEGVEQP